MAYPILKIGFQFVLVVVSYAVVGHNGADGYVALMAICTFPVSYRKPITFLIKLAISGASIFIFQKRNRSLIFRVVPTEILWLGPVVFLQTPRSVFG